MFWAIVLVAAASFPEVSFDEAERAASSSPAVVAARKAVEVRGTDAATLSHPLQVQAAPGYRATPEEDRGLDFQVSVTQQFSLAGEESARARVGSSERAFLEARAAEALLAARQTIAEAWVRAWAARRVHDGATREHEVVLGAIDRIKLLVEAKALTRADLAEAEAFAAELALLILDAEGALFERGIDLAIALGRTPEAPVLARGELPDAPPLDPGRLAALESHPAVVAARRELAAASARLAHVDALAGAQLSAGVSLQRESPGSYIGFLTGTLQLPVWDVGRQERNTARSEVAATDGATLLTQQRIAGDVARALHEAHHTREVLEVLRDRLVPAAERLSESRRTLLLAGEGTMLEEVTARRQLVNARTRLAKALADEALARVRLVLLADAVSPEARR